MIQVILILVKIPSVKLNQVCVRPLVTPFRFNRALHTTRVMCAAQQQSNTPDANGVIPFILSDPGEGIAECEVLKWSVKEGDKVSQFDMLCEIQSDKAVAEITSRFDGIIKKIHYQKGQMAQVGTPLVDIYVGGGTVGETISSGDNLSPSTVPMGSPDMGLGGAKQPIIQVEGHVNSGKSGSEEVLARDDQKAMASPAVRHIAKKYGIALHKIKPSGKEGRITKEDIMNYINRPMAEEKVEKVASSPAGRVVEVAEAFKSSSASVGITEDRVVPLSGYSRIMAKTMTQSLTIPHFGLCDEIIADGMIKLRSQLKKTAEEQGVKLTYMPIILKATSMALSRYPQLNASFNEGSLVTIQKSSHNIGVAMNTPNGLVVPNIKDVQRKSILDIARELNRLQAAANGAGLGREDLSGGTISISNIGTIGGTYASPVIVAPEVAIGAVGKIQKVPRYDSHGAVVPVHIFNISWSADHRVIDGATMANFSNAWKEYLENPSAMLFEMK
ncbi:hypothetical protein PROFUN_11950 [Planoprotostelium fungivorum]|uniref:Dihydrolipoamide acetyltransferase component of pyruvate dehydrogenase complex n=1 Tax=Planoprotostelium fungivorum TaxID=1890364 RepID=A0A2P6N8X4_9EUKA|nr:hypothetical protein PROFUN_11950 [Planoprotostelium fungivorum]